MNQSETSKIWETLGEITRLELLDMTTIPKKYHEGLSYNDELNPHNTETINKLIVKKIKK